MFQCFIKLYYTISARVNTKSVTWIPPAGGFWVPSKPIDRGCHQPYFYTPMKHDKIPYLYIAGAGFSGSTLLAFLLNSHPQMASISEVEGPMPDLDIETYTCSCGALLLSCPFYLELEKSIQNMGSTFSLRDWRTKFQLSKNRAINIPLVRPLRNTLLERIRDRAVSYLPTYGNTIREVALRNLHFAKATLSLTGKKIFVDAQKDSIRIKFLKEIDEIDLKVIHLIKDARGGAMSYMKHSGRHDAKWASRRWLIANMNTDRARRYVQKTRWLRIHYSELCENYQITVDRIADFVGAERATIQRNFLDGDHHIVGNVMRLKRNQRVKKDDSWKEHLSPDDIDTIARIGGKANRYFGFEWP